MPDGIAVEMRMTLDDPGNLPHERFGLGHRVLERTATLFLHRAHPRTL